MNPIWKFFNGVVRCSICDFTTRSHFIKNSFGHKSLLNYTCIEGHYHVPAYDICLGLLRQANEVFPTWGILLCNTCSMVLALYVIWFNRDDLKDSKKTLWITITVFVSQMHLIVMFLMTLMLFMMSCVHDMMGRLQISIMLEFH